MKDKSINRNIYFRATFYTILALVVSSFMVPAVAMFLSSVKIKFIQKAAFRYFVDYTDVGSVDEFYSGLVDYAVNYAKNTEVCRHINVMSAIKNDTNSTVYLIIDGHHLRTYVNGKIIDVVAPMVKMDRKRLRILKCDFEKYGPAYHATCKTIYYHPYYDPDYKDKVFTILSILNNYENK